jgi:hypothetical protein
MYKVPKSEFFRNWGPLIEHGSHWINFIIFIIMNGKKNYTCQYKIWKEFISFDVKKEN